MAIGELQNSVAVITGASSGIGAATAQAMSRAGMRVVLAARRVDRLRDLAANIHANGGEAVVFEIDVAQAGSNEQLLAHATRAFGVVDVVFANAGYGAEMAVHDMSMTEIREMFEVNFFSATELISLAAREMIAQNRPGHLLMTSSCLSKFTIPYLGMYAATKAAQAMVTRSMRFELAPHGIEVSSVHPVSTATEFFQQASLRGGMDPQGKTVANHAPKMFIQTPEQVANAIVRCLRKPKSEVWTSLAVRLASGIINAFPGMYDIALRKQAKEMLHSQKKRLNRVKN
ncbi:MAG: SDR family NAD(P)-dependent oxidoreductase [Phycisphaerales bacterium]|nr:SDR family NAD(P)-dependent oxidoreductase [Phycisphaerales bacterium]